MQAHVVCVACKATSVRKAMGVRHAHAHAHALKRVRRALQCCSARM